MSTKIEWSDETWNPVTGCSKVSEGCRNCYAERLSLRKMQPYDTGLPWTASNAVKNVVLHPDRLDTPLRWRKPRRVFVNSMSDLFHEQVPFDFIARVFSTMLNAKAHTFQVLTKRPERMLEFFRRNGLDHRFSPSDARWPLPNVRLGVSVEDQTTADERVPFLLQSPAAVRFVSAEPLLGPIDFGTLTIHKPERPPGALQNVHGDWRWVDALRGEAVRESGFAFVIKPRLDQVIVGGESGPGARPMNPEWVRSIRGQCSSSNAAFFFKQWGAWAPDCLCDTKSPHATVKRPEPGKPGVMFRCGKKRAGRILDGREWNEEPAA